MRILLIGAARRLGHDLSVAAPASGHEVLPRTHAEMDIRDAAALDRELGAAHPDAVLSIAAFHQVEACERQPEQAFATNAFSVLNLARACSHDQAFAAYGGFNLIRFARDGTVSVQPVFTAPERYDQLQRHSMLFFTGQDELAAMQELVEGAARVLADGARPLAEFGALLDQTWHLKRLLADNISNSDLDAIYPAGRRAGALGGKLLGASGGFMLLFVPPEWQPQVRQALQSLLLVPFRFSAAGTELIHYERRGPFAAVLARDRQRVYAHHA